MTEAHPTLCNPETRPWAVRSFVWFYALGAFLVPVLVLARPRQMIQQIIDLGEVLFSWICSHIRFILNYINVHFTVEEAAAGTRGQKGQGK